MTIEPNRQRHSRTVKNRNWEIVLTQTSGNVSFSITSTINVSFNNTVRRRSIINYYENWDQASPIVVSKANSQFKLGDRGEIVIIAADYKDRISTLGGHDFVFGVNGDTAIHVSLGAGNDFGIGSFKNDTFHGDDGDDYINGNAGNDLIYGGAGNDTLDGSAGHDRIFGGGGDDRLSGDDGNDRLFAGPGSDTLYGGSGDDHFIFSAKDYLATTLHTVRIADFGNGADRIDLKSFQLNVEGGMIKDTRFNIAKDRGSAVLSINTSGNTRDYELKMRIDGMSYEKLIADTSRYLIVS